MSGSNLGWIAVAIFLGALAFAWGHPAEAPYSGWINSLQTKWGGSCCTTNDCEHHPTRQVGDHYEVLIEGEWRAVPEDAILRIENPTGEPLSCWYHGEVRCFVPASAT